MSKFLQLNFLLLLVLFASCGKKKVERTYYANYSINPSYVGSHPTSNVNAGIYLIEKEGYIECQYSLYGNVDSLAYRIRIHEQDTSQAFGYNPSPYIDLGELAKGQKANVKQLNNIDFEKFTSEFKGYFIIQDPNNISPNTSTLLVFGKIGKEW